MSPAFGFIEYAVYLAILTALVHPLGTYMHAVFNGGKTFLDPILLPIERMLHLVVGLRNAKEMRWQEYAAALVGSTFCGTLFLYAVMRMQPLLPFYFPAFMTTAMTPDLAMNTAISFITTSTWQAYGGENTMSYTSQMLALAFGSFFGGAAALASGIAFLRGMCGSETKTLGNFYVDLWRTILWLFLPISIFGALFLVWQGVPMNFAPYTHCIGLEGAAQTIAQGPVAGLELIKNLGTNGGGYFNVNGAHPYANPTPLTNLFGMLAITAIPAALTYTFGLMSKRISYGWTLYVVMVALFVAGLFTCNLAESKGNSQIATACQLASRANLEGKETRFGINESVLTGVVTSNCSTGSLNSMHDSYTPIGGMVLLVNMAVGQFIFGGDGTGLYSMIIWALMTMFIVGLMVGRTPEYAGKRIGPGEMKLVTLYTLAGPMIILLLTAISVLTNEGLQGLSTNSGPHGLTEIMFAFASANANNGQSFAGLNANSPFYNITTAIAMMVGKFALTIPALALAAHFGLQPIKVGGQGTVPGDTPTFACVMTATILIVGALSYFPSVILGPVLENGLMAMSRFF